jgi:DNA-binding winged helix-turn-helix (wHTH) protein
VASENVRWFGERCIDLLSAELRSHGRPVRLEPQPAKVLAVLVRRAGELVTRSELVREVWGSGTHVAFDDGLNYAIRALRIALDDDARAPRFIETVPRKGYRFIAPVTTMEPRRRPRRVMWACAASLALATVVLETRPNTHHETTLRVLTAVHHALFGR